MEENWAYLCSKGQLRKRKKMQLQWREGIINETRASEEVEGLRVTESWKAKQYLLLNLKQESKASVENWLWLWGAQNKSSYIIYVSQAILLIRMYLHFLSKHVLSLAFICNTDQIVYLMKKIKQLEKNNKLDTCWTKWKWDLKWDRTRKRK